MDLKLSYWPATKEMSVLDTNCGDILRTQARLRPNAVALKSADIDPLQRRTWTYSELLEEAESIAGFFVQRFEPGCRIAIIGGNEPEWVILQFALALSRMVLVTVNPASRPAELAYLLSHSESRVIFHQGFYRGVDLLDLINEACCIQPNVLELKVGFDDLLRVKVPLNEALLPSLFADDPCMIQYTSGTTGRPKGVVLSNRAVTNNARMMAAIKGLNSDTINLGSPPPPHTGGCVGGVLSSVQTGGTFLLPESFDADWVLDLIQQEAVTYAFAVPTMLVAMLESHRRSPRDLTTLTTIFTGGTIVPVEIVRRVEAEFEVILIIGYGMTETSPAITHTRLTDSPKCKSETVGFAIPQVEVKIVDVLTGVTVPINKEGELCTRGFHLMKEYHNDPSATAETIDPDGWLHTGDLCSMDQRGYCRVSGRLKDMIIRGGENIYPREIEDVLYGYPSVREASVLGVHDDYWGEKVVCVLVLNKDLPLDESEFKAYIYDRLARHKVPKSWFSLDQLPMTVSGKVQKFELKKQIENGLLAPLLF